MLTRLVHGCAVLAALLIGLVLALVCFDVIGRNLGMNSLPWIVEVTEYTLPIATLLAAPWLLERNEHVRLDLLGATLSPAAMRRIDRVAAACGLVISAVLTVYSVRVILDTRAAGGLVLKSLVFPEWWLFAPLPLGFTLLAAVSLRKLLRPDPHPSAHPLDLARGE